MKIFDLKIKYVPSIISEDNFKKIILFLKNKAFFISDDTLNPKEFKKFLNIINKVSRTKKPLAYIINKKFFYKSDFFINKNVLIPRYETELIVEEVLKFDLVNKNVLDLCCGSGCIGISLKQEFNDINLYLSDYSKSALKVCKKNLRIKKMKAKIFYSNFLDFIFEKNLKMDFILINPPYINKNDINIEKNVKLFEPWMALFAKDNGLFFYKVLFKNLEKLFLLNNNLVIISEFGFNQKEEIELLFNSKGVRYNLEFKKDFSNHWRYFVLKNGDSNG
ncbi:peptide chain release factor N(5)-glutamine methyltransferase [Spiroplasma taiwanense]|uniref:peptide chain release factor N(5)-glutamine methyltransferase n=1 Tax=Spiroplasma taiwanense CT-1 TaxID=1276220 RepID=S5MD56_9MOLU|nr:peptide chain release factor N(5)-glutamine methyltransferase [Spiroplasma taiwanense]AGR41643.1 N5-glutamine S-adenosyl-L-methionine-dependent methyltransferase [Spiroplasma taiwanense CT-1]